MKKTMIINQINCTIETDENGFFNLFTEDTVTEDWHIYPEWIVRGAITRAEAIKQAQERLEILKEGRSLMHDAEGFRLTLSAEKQAAIDEMLRGESY